MNQIKMQKDADILHLGNCLRKRYFRLPATMGDKSGGEEEPPDQVASGGLYSDRVKVTIAHSERLKRNVLEINLESENSAGKIEKGEVAKLFQTLGINLEQEMEGYQLVGRRKLFAWLKEEIDLTQYCR
jgi:hypothetical protein